MYTNKKGLVYDEALLVGASSYILVIWLTAPALPRLFPLLHLD